MSDSEKTIHNPPSTIHQTKFVYFDLDDTLLDHRRAERAALLDLKQRFGAHLGDVADEHLHQTYHTHNAPLWAAYARGEIEKAELKRLRFERLLEALAVSGLAPGAVGEAYMERYAEHWAFTRGAERAFATIAERFPVGVLTNGFAATQRAKLSRFPAIRDRLSATVISEDIGALKPHPDVFAHATQKAGVEAAHILYVGDSYRSDVEGGRAAGWQVAWYAPDEEAHESKNSDSKNEVFRFRRWNALLRRLQV